MFYRNSMAELKIMDFAVIIRNVVDLGKPKSFFGKERSSEIFKDIIADSTEYFETMHYVFSQVCSLSKYDMIHLELPEIQMLQRSRILYENEDTIIQAFAKGPCYTAQVYPSLHRSGALITNLHIRFQSEAGYSIEDAIELARLNLRTLAIKIPEKLCKGFQWDTKLEHIRWIQRPEGTFLIGNLKDFTSELLRPLFINALSKTIELNPLRDHRCISSTLVQVYKTNPPCDSIREFTDVKNFGKAIRGLGCLDRNYETRSDDIVAESFSHDLASDEEVAVYTFGLSDLMLLDTSFEQTVDETFKSKKMKDRYAAVLYNTCHYSSLLEWVYLEKYLIDLYSVLLSREIAGENTTPEKMLALEKQTMHDLIAYRSGITPYPSREEFLEKARQAHRIPELQEKLEKKRDLATDYVIQEYTLRTNKSIQLVNIFISATAAFGLMEVVLSISNQPDEKHVFWGIVTSILFVITLSLLWGVSKILMARKK